MRVCILAGTIVLIPLEDTLAVCFGFLRFVGKDGTGQCADEQQGAQEQSDDAFYPFYSASAPLSVVSSGVKSPG